MGTEIKEIGATSPPEIAENHEPSLDGQPMCDKDENVSEDKDTSLEVPPMSKKMQRRLRKKKKWLEFKPLKRAKEREKLKQKRQEARMNNIDLGPSRKKLKQSTMANSSCKIKVAVDMDFDDYMNPRDLGKCVKQLLHCYTLNRRAEDPMQLYFTSFNGKAKDEMSKNNGYGNWDVNFCENSYLEVFPKESIVYLSSESDNIISTLEDDKVYIIGGLVDHNAHKGLCHKLAVEKGICHGQLPISEYLEMKSRKVLTIDHVFEILLGVSTGLTWKDAFMRVIPNRKGALVKNEDSQGENKNVESAVAAVEQTLCAQKIDNGEESSEISDQKTSISDIYENSVRDQQEVEKTNLGGVKNENSSETKSEL